MTRNAVATGKKFAAIVLALTALAGLPATISAQSNSVPVMIGGEEGDDACGSLGGVTGLELDGDNFLAVRNGPGGKYKMIDKLYAKQYVSMCDEQGDWIGIVYKIDDSKRCGVGSPVPVKQAYNGPCKSGWVHKKFITLIAG